MKKNFLAILVAIVIFAGLHAQSSDYEYKVNVRNAGKWDMVNTKASIGDQIHDSIVNKSNYNLPSQISHEGEFLSTNGTLEGWKPLPVETDPVFSSSPAKGITLDNITNWNTGFSWGNHAIQGYLKVETDPVFALHPAHNIINTGDGSQFLSNDGSYKNVTSLTPGDNVLKWDVFNHYYRPYTSKSEGGENCFFYSDISKPDNNNKFLCLNGNLYSSRLYASNVFTANTDDDNPAGSFGMVFNNFNDDNNSPVLSLQKYGSLAANKSVTGDLLYVRDDMNVSGSGAFIGSLIRADIGPAYHTVIDFKPRATTGTVYKFDTYKNLTSGYRARFYNNNANPIDLEADGSMNLPSGAQYKIAGVSIGGIVTETDPVFVSHPAHNIVNSGDGTKFLSNDGTYKTISPGNTPALLSASVTITPAQMGNQSDPESYSSHNYTEFVSVLPAPGAGKVIFPYMAIIVNLGNTTNQAYYINPANGAFLVLKYGTGTNYLFSDVLYGNALFGSNPLYTSVPFSSTFQMGDYENAQVAVSFDVSAIWVGNYQVTGNEPKIKIILYYTILDLN